MTERLHLAEGDYEADLLPGTGGSIAALRWRHPAHGWTDLMRPFVDLEEPGSRPENVLATASFPLTPYANRVRDGRFTFRGRSVVLPPPAIGKHALHGHGWLRPWQVGKTGPNAAVLELRHAPDEWPYTYDIKQEFEVSADGFVVRMAATNTGAEAMPYGFGMHPYFPRTPQCHMQAAVQAFWEVDAEVMPVRHTTLPPGLDPCGGLAVDGVVCDNVFTGWDGRAAITWPERGTRLRLSASPVFGTLYLYVPAGETYFCLEPASHVTDALNRAPAGAADTGLIVLDPGATVSAEVTFTAEPV